MVHVVKGSGTHEWLHSRVSASVNLEMRLLVERLVAIR